MDHGPWAAQRWRQFSRPPRCVSHLRLCAAEQRRSHEKNTTAQLLLTSTVGLATLFLILGAHPGWLIGALVGFGLLQLPSLNYIWRQERSAGFLAMSLGLIAIRNTAWLLGVLRALAYVLTIPPELRAAAQWRKRRKTPPDNPVGPRPVEVETEDSSSQEPAKARASGGGPG